MIVNEAGASVYSASKLAAEEFPEYDVNLRSAVSIARRLQDPLAELVKIDPKAIGVGQYQHDMPQARLAEALDGVVEDCVNAVGVDVNTASPSLLQRVSGLTAATAKNLVKYREENGAFTTRRQVLKVPKLGPRPLSSAPAFCGCRRAAACWTTPPSTRRATPPRRRCWPSAATPLSDVRAGAMGALKEKAEAMGLEALARVCGVGVPTLADIIKELMKPGRDPRDELPPPILRTDVLEAGPEARHGAKGTVCNIIDFGVFVDIGVHQDGLVHISKLPQRVKHPSQLLSVGDVVTVWVLEVDEKKKRISLTMKKTVTGAAAGGGHLRPPVFHPWPPLTAPRSWPSSSGGTPAAAGPPPPPAQTGETCDPAGGGGSSCRSTTRPSTVTSSRWMAHHSCRPSRLDRVRVSLGPVPELTAAAGSSPESSPRSAGQKHRPAPSGQLPPPLRCPGETTSSQGDPPAAVRRSRSPSCRRTASPMPSLSSATQKFSTDPAPFPPQSGAFPLFLFPPRPFFPFLSVSQPLFSVPGRSALFLTFSAQMGYYYNCYFARSRAALYCEGSLLLWLRRNPATATNPSPP